MTKEEKNILMQSAINWKTKYNALIIPVGDNKSPKNGFEWKELTSEKQSVQDIVDIFNKNNIERFAILIEEGVVCVDVDKHKFDGVDSIEKWQSENGEFPNTYTEDTPSGGKHYFFKVNGKYKFKRGILDGVDIIASRHYCIVSPSKGYSDNKAKIASANESVYKLIESKKGDETIGNDQYETYEFSNSENHDDEKIYEGSRVNELVSMVGTLVNKGYSENEIKDFIIGTNQNDCVPPLSENELETQVFTAIANFRENEKSRMNQDFKGVMLLDDWEDTLKMLHEDGTLGDYVITLFNYEKYGIVPNVDEMDRGMKMAWCMHRKIIDKYEKKKTNRAKSMIGNKNARKR